MISKTTCKNTPGRLLFTEAGAKNPAGSAGHAMYILGNIRIGQDRLVEAYQLHERALTCWKQTYGVHHKTGDANYKLAWHLAYRKEWDKAL